MKTVSADVSHYTFRVAWSPEDNEHVATCLEFPSLSWLSADSVSALTGLQDLIADVVRDLEAEGEPVPEPLADRTYSGKFNLRLPVELHRALATEAAMEKVSLNQLVVQRLVSTQASSQASRSA